MFCQANHITISRVHCTNTRTYGEYGKCVSVWCDELTPFHRRHHLSREKSLHVIYIHLKLDVFNLHAENRTEHNLNPFESKSISPKLFTQTENPAANFCTSSVDIAMNGYNVGITKFS